MDLALVIADPGISNMYVQFHDVSDTTLQAPEGSGDKAGTYGCTNAQIQAAGLAVGTHSGRFRAGDYQSVTVNDVDWGDFSGMVWDGTQIVQGSTVVGISAPTSNIVLDSVRDRHLWKLPRGHDGAYVSTNELTAAPGERPLFGWDCEPFVGRHAIDRISTMIQPTSSSPALVVPSSVSGEWGHDVRVAKGLVAIDGTTPLGKYKVFSQVTLQSGAGPYKLVGRLEVVED